MPILVDPLDNLRQKNDLPKIKAELIQVPIMETNE